MGDNDDLTRSQTRLAGPGRSGATVHVTTGPAAKITSETVATVPTNRARLKLGVGEQVKLTFSTGSAAWTAAPAVGSFDTTTGATVTFTAPDSANTIVITATGTGGSPTITFKVVEPNDVKMSRRPGTLGHHTNQTASAGFIADIHIFPADVSFENCSYLEKDVNAVGTGVFKEYYEKNQVGHNPATTPIPIGPPTSNTSGSLVNGYDQVDCSASKGNGGWTWSIPWTFQVGSGTPKQFKVVDQIVQITAAGQATVRKAGAHNSSAYNDPDEADPLFT